MNHQVILVISCISWLFKWGTVPISGSCEGGCSWSEFLIWLDRAGSGFFLAKCLCLFSKPHNHGSQWTTQCAERVPGCRGVGAVLADGVACLHSAQAEPRLGSGCPCCAGCIGFHGRNHASWGLEGSPCWHRLVHQAFDLLHLPAVRPSLLGVPPLQLPLGLGLLRGTGHGHQPDPAWDAARWGSPRGISVSSESSE